MSFRGLNFSEQLVNPEDDGRLYEAIFTDGILSGCAITAVGYTLTIAPGHLMIAGRQIKVNAAQNHAMNGAAEGFGRVVLTIDLSGAATESSFSQVSSAVEYALSTDGFPALIQGDINGDKDKVYQIVLAVCSLSPNGITQIISSIPNADFKEGNS
ncbi:MAG: hypothetical protein IJV41_00745 [Oscillospiraceae bacterium]|nr:hypothetical protein [Oscillospiraceae bacterium]